VTTSPSTPDSTTGDQPGTEQDRNRRRALLAFDVESAASQAVSALVNDRYGPDLPAMFWRPITHQSSSVVTSLTGQAPVDLTQDDAAAALAAWADRYDLQPADNPTRGTTELRGQLDGLPVEIWAVTDRTLFETGTTTSSSPAAPTIRSGG
jgi:hypothetical protein